MTKTQDETIKLNEQTGEWVVEADTYRYGNTNLNTVRHYIEKQQKTPFKRFKAYRTSYARLAVVEVTSVGENGDIWFKTAKGERSKDSKYCDKNFFPMNAENDALFAEYQRRQSEKDALSEQISALSKEQSVIVGQVSGNAFAQEAQNA